MPPDSFLHERSDFKALVATVADSEKINDPALVEKDYWITFAIRMATCSGSAGDSSPKSRNLNLRGVIAHNPRE